MIPQKQTILTDRTVDPPIVGNCFQAAVASLLDLPLEDVPHFCDSGKWPMNFHRWLEQRGLTSVEFAKPDLDGRACFWGHHIISGDSPRVGRHAVIGLNGVPVFDPHPSNEMLKPRETGDWVFTFIFRKR